MPSVAFSRVCKIDHNRSVGRNSRRCTKVGDVAANSSIVSGSNGTF